MKFFVRCPTTSVIFSLNDQSNIFQENWFYDLGLLVAVFFLNYEQGYSIQTLIAQMDELNIKWF